MSLNSSSSVVHFGTFEVNFQSGELRRGDRRAVDARGLWRVPLSGGSEEKVLDYPPSGFWGYWAVSANGIYNVDEPAPRARIRFRNFRTRSDSVVKVMSNAARIGSLGMGLSPNGSVMVFVQLDQFTSDLILVEDFH